MFDKNLTIHIDGEYARLSDVGVSPATHSLHYGTGIFEGIRAYKTENDKTAIFRLDDHIERFFYSAKVIGMNLPVSEKELTEICLEVLRRNNLKSAYIRPLAFFDDSSLGITTKINKVRLLVMAWEWGKYLSESVKTKISKYRRISEKSTVVDAKISGHYVNSLLATMEVKASGFDEAVLLDHNGFIAEGPGENIFFVENKKLYTPKVDKILPGITRDSVIELAKDLGYEVVEKNISPERLSDFEGAFFTGTAAEVTPIKSVLWQKEEIKFNPESGKDIKDLFFVTVSGGNDKKLNWLTFV